MAALVVQLKNADRMIASVKGALNGIEIAFADGRRGVVPYSELPEVGSVDNLKTIELPNAYEAVLHTKDGETVEIPWDFARAFCDASFRERAEQVAGRGRQAIGGRVRELRKASGLTQEELASRAKLGRVTLVRIENGEQSPRYETLLALARAMEREPAELLRTSEALSFKGQAS
jgi:DNA-binding XRE family transcriptional regulator